MQETNRAPLTRFGNALVAAAFAICFVLAFSLLSGLHVFDLKDGNGTPFFIALVVYLWPTTQLIVGSFVLAVPFGLAASRAPAIGRILRAVPIFWLAAIGVFVVAAFYRHHSTDAFGAASSARFDIGDRFVHLLGPAAILALFQVPAIAEFFTKRFQGSAHPPLPGALFALFARRLPDLIGAAILVELPFAWPGMSRLFVTGLRTGDAVPLAGIIGAMALVALALRAVAVRDD